MAAGLKDSYDKLIEWKEMIACCEIWKCNGAKHWHLRANKTQTFVFDKSKVCWRKRFKKDKKKT